MYQKKDAAVLSEKHWYINRLHGVTLQQTINFADNVEYSINTTI